MAYFPEHLNNSLDGAHKPLGGTDITAGGMGAGPSFFSSFWLIAEAAILKGKEQIFSSLESIKEFLRASEGNWFLSSRGTRGDWPQSSRLDLSFFVACFLYET